MKNLKKMAYIILIIIIVVLSLTIYTNASKNNEEDQKQKTLSEIKFLDSKIVDLLNSLNNIEFENYKISSIEANKQSDKEKNSDTKQSPSGGEESSESASQSQESGGSGGDSSKTTAKINNSNQKFELISSGVLNSNEQIRWDDIKSQVEMLYSSMPTLTLDLYQLNVNQEDILSFNKELDNLALSVKNEEKEQSIKQLSRLYEYIPKFANNVSDEELYKNVLEVKSNIFKAYKELESENWEEISKNVVEAINVYNKLLTLPNIEASKQYMLNKGYILINELQNTINMKDKEIFLIKYKNLLEELNNL